MNKKITAVLTWLLVLAFAITVFVACKPSENGGVKHECKHVCSICGKCQDIACTDPTCKEKCEHSLVDLTERSATGSNGAVAAANPYASKAGLDILKMGGNAFDAGVATAFAIGVVEPYASGVGGGGVMTGYNAKTGQYVFVNYREFLPGSVSIAEKEKRGLNFDDDIGSAAVPTQVAGMCTIVEKFGSGNVTLADILAPAINLAENGFIVTKALAESFDTGYNKFQSLNIESAMNNFTDGFETLREGAICKQPEYAKVLKEIAAKGRDGFYKGWVADAIVKAYSDRNGFVTQADLDYANANYPKVGSPLVTEYNGYEIATANIPSSGGIILIETLNMLSHYCTKSGTTLKTLREKSELEYVHVVATAMQLAAADKRRYIADNDKNPATGESFVDVPIKGLSSADYAAQRWDALFDPNSSLPVQSGADWGGASDRVNRTKPDGTKYAADKSPFEFNGTTALASGLDENEDDHGTTSFFAVDKEGNISGYTQTINHFWGAYVVPDGCGFFLNNQSSSFSETATSASESVHYAAPYKQPVSHIMPTIVMKDGSPVATFGSPGSTRIPSAVTQVCLNILEFGMGMQEAIAAKRFYNWGVYSSQDNPVLNEFNANLPEGAVKATLSNRKVIFLEEGFSEETKAGLIKRYYAYKEYDGIDLYFGGVQGIMFNYDANGNLVSLTGGADPRRDGKALAF